MKHFSQTHRRGSTLVELLIFLALLCVVIGAILPVLFSATENRLLQQTIAAVEQNGAQLLQTMSLRVRQAERIVSPAIGQTGSILMLQTGSGDTNPTLIGTLSGTLIIIRHAQKQVVSSPQVAVSDVVFRNTSTSATRQSAQVIFKLSRSIRLQNPHVYTQLFQSAFSLMPDDVTVGGISCGCDVPICLGSNQFLWGVCENATCFTATTALKCP